MSTQRREIGTHALSTERYGLSRQCVSTWALSLVVAAVFYNAVLAALNAAGLHQSYGSVALTEATILGASAVYIIAAKLPVFIPLSVTIVVFGIVVTLYVSFASQAPVLDCARSAAIIGVFTMLGSVSTERQIFLVFRLLSGAVLAVLLLEIFDTPLFVRIFQPADYYTATRGIEAFSLDDSGLFRNALGFQGRFTFGLSDHRTASIFIEQVSLANFCGVLVVYLLACHDRLGRSDRLLHIVTVVLVLLSNDTRTTSIFALLSFVGVYLYPFLPPRMVFAVMPAVLASGFAVVQTWGLSSADDLQGRLSTTVLSLESLDWTDWLGFGARHLGGYMDSGYPYVVAGSTICGLLFFWVLLATALPGNTAPRRRCLFGLNLYMCFNLMIGGTAVFSIKIAAPLWLLIGYMNLRAPTTKKARSKTERRMPADAVAGLA